MGWYLRSDIIWYKPNCQPESVKDRPTQSHEYIFMFSKSEKYYYDYESIKEPAQTKGKSRNRRTVWQINTEPFPEAHFATFPTKLLNRSSELVPPRDRSYLILFLEQVQ